jgi:hypothetical protein
LLVETLQDLGGSQENEKKNNNILLLVFMGSAVWNTLLIIIYHGLHFQNQGEESSRLRTLTGEEVQATTKSPAVPALSDIECGSKG